MSTTGNTDWFDKSWFDKINPNDPGPHIPPYPFSNPYNYDLERIKEAYEKGREDEWDELKAKTKLLKDAHQEGFEKGYEAGFRKAQKLLAKGKATQFPHQTTWRREI